MSKITLCLGILVLCLILSGCFRVSNPMQWICYYGEPDKIINPGDFKLIILEPDNVVVAPEIPSTLFIGYISLGEAEEFRWYWDEIKNEGFVLDENPDWEGDYYVDVRDPLWQKYVVDHIIPEILNKGFDGLFMDTIDTAEYLEYVDAEKYAGSVDAMVDMIKKIRVNYPDIYIISNNGLILLDKITDCIDFALVEDLYTTYDFDKNKYGVQSSETTAEMFNVLKNFSKTTDVPILTLDYVDPSNKKDIKKVMKKSRSDGFCPYVADIHLLALPDNMTGDKE